MASQPFIRARAWRTPEGWSICFATHQGRYATVVTRARSREHALRLAALLERRERRARRLLEAAVSREGRT